MVRLSSAGLALAGAALALLFCGGLLVYGAGRGIDLTDEIFYLVWARDPEAYALLYQPFGYLLHPLYALLGGDVARYRLVGFAITAAAGALLGRQLAPEGALRLPFATFGAAAALVIYFPWIVTPSYNSAANVGAMLVLAGVATLLRAGAIPVRAAASLAIACGLCAAAFAKPPLFALGSVLAVALAAWSFRRNRGRSIALLGAMALAMLLIALFLPLPRIPGLLARIAASQHILALPNTPTHLPIKVLGDWAAVPPLLWAAALAALGALALRRTRWADWLGHGAMAFGLANLASTIPDTLDGGIPEFPGLALLLIATGYAALFARRDLLLLALLLVAPFAVALGTFNNQWAQLDFSMTFPLVALFRLASDDPLRWRRAAATLLSLAAPPLLLLAAAAAPYSLPDSIFAQTIPVRHPLTGSPLLVDQETADFLNGTQGKAAGALLVDLSGTGPGVAAALGAKAPVLLWLNPATATWPDVVWSRLTERERARVWFVAPVLPLFAPSAPARWLAAHRGGYCRTPLPRMTFWWEERSLELWRPCPAPRAHPEG
ncbi:hypothetical protein SAMN03159338_2659 [Sphingomonas sp. NFR04]|uniref:US12 family protein n=1 Tax=Sphingomonas sp. NFR04 TaxID=1566283 RepID=UPI0008E80057|nr:US12 family protein [Sphingomonas sp. NFR04]SFJ88434.1 hypothetical protein SAMN03159338_2659 [Sphingomonas sp. NFR04]